MATTNYDPTKLFGSVSLANGYFDVLMDKVDTTLKKQKDAGLLTGSNYATVYVTAIQTVIQEAVALSFKEAELNNNNLLLNEKIITEQKQQTLLDNKNLSEVQQTALLTEQQKLYITQKNAYKVEAKQKQADLIKGLKSVIWSQAAPAAPGPDYMLDSYMYDSASSSGLLAQLDSYINSMVAT